MDVPAEGMKARGLVVRSTGSWHEIAIGGDIVSSRIPGRFRMTETEATSPVCVGDNVTIVLQGDGTGVVTEVEERVNKLSRRAAGHRAPVEHVIAANIDRVLVIQSVERPRLNSGFIDRVLVMAEVEEIPAGLVINKSDLIQSESAKEVVGAVIDMYEGVGYPVLLICAETGDGLQPLHGLLKGCTTLFIGQSGVGKSTLLNRLEPNLSIPTNEVSRKTNKGKHTTTFAALHSLAERTLVVDTPGIREFGIWDVEPEDLGSFFVEFRAFSADCHYHNCLHDHEPGCAVKLAVDQGEIHERRYVSYLNILYDLQAS